MTSANHLGVIEVGIFFWQRTPTNTARNHTLSHFPPHLDVCEHILITAPTTVSSIVLSIIWNIRWQRQPVLGPGMGSKRVSLSGSSRFAPFWSLPPPQGALLKLGVANELRHWDLSVVPRSLVSLFFSWCSCMFLFGRRPLDPLEAWKFSVRNLVQGSFASLFDHSILCGNTPMSPLGRLQDQRRLFKPKRVCGNMDAFRLSLS